MFLGDGRARNHLAQARVREQRIDAALRALHRLIKSIEIGELRNIALDAGGLRTQQCDRRIELIATTAHDEYMCSFLDEPLRSGEPYSGGPTGDHRDFVR